MNLTTTQMEFYHENGHFILENLFSKDEVNELSSKIAAFKNFKHLPNIVCEDDGSVRSVYMPNRHEEVYETLYRCERLVEPCKQLLENDIYLYQYKLNLKRAFTGQAWEWHQDYTYWKIDDGVEKPDMISGMIYLNDVKSYQGPLMIIPGSHKFDVVDFEPKEHLEELDELINSLSADLKFTVEQSYIKKMANKNGIKVLEYNAGTCVFFHPNLFHASMGNLSPYKRDTAIITYNSVDNLPKILDRPSYICSDVYTAIEPSKMAFC